MRPTAWADIHCAPPALTASDFASVQAVMVVLEAHDHGAHDQGAHDQGQAQGSTPKAHNKVSTVNDPGDRVGSERPGCGSERPGCFEDDVNDPGAWSSPSCMTLPQLRTPADPTHARASLWSHATRHDRNARRWRLADMRSELLRAPWARVLWARGTQLTCSDLDRAWVQHMSWTKDVLDAVQRHAKDFGGGHGRGLDEHQDFRNRLFDLRFAHASPATLVRCASKVFSTMMPGQTHRVAVVAALKRDARTLSRGLLNGGFTTDDLRDFAVHVAGVLVQSVAGVPVQSVDWAPPPPQQQHHHRSRQPVDRRVLRWPHNPGDCCHLYRLVLAAAQPSATAGAVGTAILLHREETEHNLDGWGRSLCDVDQWPAFRVKLVTFCAAQVARIVGVLRQRHTDAVLRRFATHVARSHHRGRGTFVAIVTHEFQRQEAAEARRRLLVVAVERASAEAAATIADIVAHPDYAQVGSPGTELEFAL